jgi:hypothetical protein
MSFGCENNESIDSFLDTQKQKRTSNIDGMQTPDRQTTRNEERLKSVLLRPSKVLFAKQISLDYDDPRFIE